MITNKLLVKIEKLNFRYVLDSLDRMCMLNSIIFGSPIKCR